jgi:hypothetical protein
MMVTLLTGTGQSETTSGRMPGTDTSYLSETTMSLAGKSGHTPTGNNTLSSVTTSGRADIKSLTEREDRVDVKVLLEEVLGEVNLVGNRTSVKLDLTKMSYFLSQLNLTNLGVSEHTHDTTVILDAVELELDVLGLLGVLLRVFGKCLSLGAVPVLVESALNLIGQMLSPDGGQGTKTMGGLNVSNNTDHSHGRSLEDGDSLDTVLLVDHLGTRTLNLTHDVGHTSLVSNEGSKRHRGGGVKVLGERTHAASMMSGTLLGKKPEGSMTRCFELTVRHVE